MFLHTPNQDGRAIMLHSGQYNVFTDPTRFKVVTAGRRWGKTVLALVFAINMAKRPFSKVWYIAPSYRMAKQIMWDQLQASIPPEWIKKVHQTDLSIRLINGSIIECKGADDPDSLRGVGLYYAILDEFQDMKTDTWTKVIRPTLARDRGHALFIGTPKGYANLYDFHQLGQDPMKPAWKSWVYPTITSPFIPAEEIEEARRDMDIKSFRQEFEASFETMSGRVYHPFDRNTHVKPLEFNPNLPIWIGQDFNVDPMSSAVIQPQTNGEIWIVDEIHRPNSNTVEVCDELERRYWRHMNDERKVCVYPDPAGGNRQSARGESDLDIFRQRGFKYIKYRRKHPAISDRVNAVNRMLMDATGQIRLRVDPKCKNVVASFEQVIYREGTPDIDKRPGVEHMTDAVGYPIELEFPTRKIKIAGRSL